MAWPTSKNLGFGKFWGNQEVRDKAGFCEPLARLGKWYANMLTNNVHGERCFAQMRSFESPLRLSMSRESLRELVLARTNFRLVEQLHWREQQLQL